MFKNIFKHKILSENKPISVIGLNKNSQASYVWSLFCVSKKSILIVTNTLYEATNLYKSLSFYDEKRVFFFPMDDFLVSEALAISPDLMSKRIEVLNELSDSQENKIVITNLMGYLRFLPSKDLWKRSSIILKKGSFISRKNLLEKLDIMGYEKVSLVTKTGEYANRGYILDVFAYGEEKPFRMEFFDDELEGIRCFDTGTQLSLETKKEISILPFTEFINEKKITEIPKRQSLLPRVVNRVSSIQDYLNNYTTILINLDEIRLGYQRLLEEIIEFKQTDAFSIDNYMHKLDELLPLVHLNLYTTDNYNNYGEKEIYITKEIDVFNENFILIDNFLKKALNENKKVVVCLDNNRMINEFLSRTKVATILTNIYNIKNNIVNVIDYKLDKGFEINDFVFLSSNEIYKRQITINYKSKFKYGSKIKDINTLQIGDFVVHSSFGIGRYLGIVTLTPKGLKKDYIHLQYKDNDKLYIPVEKIELISKFSSNEGVMPRLNKLGGTDWVKQKARIKGKVMDIARQLLETSAKRKLIKGFAFLKDDEDQYAFERNFMYQETPDQLNAIRDIKEDMELAYPMDRLLCGDVGYGKTEVAFRAIFKAIKSGKQVAFLCPTTILSKQHYDCLFRLDHTPGQ